MALPCAIGAIPPYIAAQGTALHRAGRVHLRHDETDVWVGGDVVNVITGTINL